jgi:hypothetical protein
VLWLFCKVNDQAASAATVGQKTTLRVCAFEDSVEGIQNVPLSARSRKCSDRPFVADLLTQEGYDEQRLI